MFFRKKKSNTNSILGVDINREQLKIVELEKIENDPEYDFKILNYVIQDLHKGVVHINDNVEPQILGETIREITEKEGFSKKNVIAAIPSERLLVKTFTTSIESNEDEIENQIKASSKTHAINGIETMAFDFYEGEETEGEKTIILKMCPIEAIQTREDALLIGELTPLVIETDDMPLKRLIKTFTQQFKQEKGFDLKESDVFIFVEIRKQVVITHTFQNGVIQATKTDILKKDMSSEEDIEDQIVDILRKTSFVAKSNSENFKGIFLSGKMEELFKLINTLEESDHFDDLEILVANPLLRIKYAGVNREAIALASSSLVTACGLAMRGGI